MSDVVTSNVPATKSRRFKVASQRPSGQAGSSGHKARIIRGLGPMTRVTTSFGDYPAQTLRERDRVLTSDGDFVPIQSIHRITLDSDYLNYHPSAQPILIRAGAFAQGIPAADILLAPYQKIDTGQAFIRQGAERALDAISRAQVFRKSETVITYTMFRCARPVSVRCEGLWIDMVY